MMSLLLSLEFFFISTCIGYPFDFINSIKSDKIILGMDEKSRILKLYIGGSYHLKGGAEREIYIYL